MFKVTRANNVRCITRGVENVEHQISEQDASFSNYFLFQAAKKKLYLIKAPREHASYVLLFVLLIGYQIITPSVYPQYFLVKITQIFFEDEGHWLIHIYAFSTA